MEYQEALAYIHSRGKFGSVLGLERVEALLALLGHPEEKLRFIHVAGTNGKGSTSAMFAAVLTHAGYKTGLYISPFVEDFRERMQIDRLLIPQTELAFEVEKIIPAVEKVEADLGHPVTEFELETAMALDYFARSGCDFAVMEVGLGGRFDATNIIKKPLLSAICYIGLDHTAILGDTYAKIAFEKCGIIKEGCPVVSYVAQRPEALDVIKEQAALMHSPLLLPDSRSLQIRSLTPAGSEFSYKGQDYTLSIPGEHIVKNALSVIEGISYLDASFPGLTAHIAPALSAVAFGGRFERVAQDCYIDAAHNPDCVDAVTAMIDSFWKGKKLIVVMGILGDKDHTYCIREIARRADSFYAVTPHTPRAQSAEKTAEEASEDCRRVTACASVGEACGLALAEKAASPGSVILALGSLYYIGESKKEFLARL